MSYEPQGYTLPSNSHANSQKIEPGLSAFGLAAEGVELKPGMNKKIPDLNKPVKCTPRLMRL